ncbi:hypothetical protein RIF29_15334 [Crotalaria pallida]|uniref:Uncharacterized protein n=1 Tax=Crotalaria pallida TaxID=3830 RepID=A0AAN9ICI2_CROPI
MEVRCEPGKAYRHRCEPGKAYRLKGKWKSGASLVRRIGIDASLVTDDSIANLEERDDVLLLDEGLGLATPVLAFTERYIIAISQI